jgi:hypothetical protein
MCVNPASTDDPLFNTPDLIFINIASYLSLSDLYNLSALSKAIRYRCLTTTSFQYLVRNRLFETWAVPISREYAFASRSLDEFPHPNARGDWLHYGYQVFKTDSMRNRRRIFNIITQIKSQYFVKAVEEGYLAGPHAEQKQMYLRAIVDQQLLLGKLNEMYDFELFIKALTVFNKAYEKDLTKQKFRGSKLPQAVEIVKALMEGKPSNSKSRPSQAVERRMMAKIDERMKLLLIEKQMYRRPRRAEPHL